MAEYLGLYEYDRSEPLDPVFSESWDREGYVAYKLYYRSVGGQKVPALLTIPKEGEPPCPCIVFLHGYGGRKEDGLYLADVFSTHGYSVFSIDAPFHGERSEPGKVLYSPDPEKLKVNVIQTVLDLRSGVGLLETRDDVDDRKIGYGGGSMGVS